MLKCRTKRSGCNPISFFEVILLVMERTLSLNPVLKVLRFLRYKYILFTQTSSKSNLMDTIFTKIVLIIADYNVVLHNIESKAVLRYNYTISDRYLLSLDCLNVTIPSKLTRYQ